MLLFLLKIALPPILVAVMSLAARWWGPNVGGLLMGLPWMTGPVLFFLALDKGDAFGVGACIGIEIGVVCICAYMLAYAGLAAFAAWPLCLAAAATAFLATALAVHGLDVSLMAAAAAAAASLAVTLMILPRPRAPPVLAAVPWWDIPMRMLAALALVSVIMLTADALGPRLSGIVSTFPVIVTVVGAFTHHRWGPDAIRRMLRGLAQALFAFVAFFVVVGWSLPVVGLVAAFALATVVALGISAALLALSRRWAMR